MIDVRTAIGQFLDRAGEIARLPRRGAESDDAYRERLLARLGPGNHYIGNLTLDMPQGLRQRLYWALRRNDLELFVTREEDLILRCFGHRGDEFLGLYIIVVDVELP